jgi:hypothetical protein
MKSVVLAALLEACAGFLGTVERLLELGSDMSDFDDFDMPGITGTTMQDTLNFEAARWLVRSIPRRVEIAWDDDEDERATGSTSPRCFPYSPKTATWKPTFCGGAGWIGPEGVSETANWLIRPFEHLKASAENRERAAPLKPWPSQSQPLLDPLCKAGPRVILIPSRLRAV